MKRIFPMSSAQFVRFESFVIIRVIRHLTLIKKSSRRTAFIKDLPIAEVNMLMDDQV